MNKEVRKAIKEAQAAGLTIRELTGHTWGWIICEADNEHIAIYSTGRNAEFGAKLLRRFIARHRDHKKGDQP